jgi:hypothetical protein
MDDARLKVLQAVERYENAARAHDTARHRFNAAQAELDGATKTMNDTEWHLVQALRDLKPEGGNPVINNGVVYMLRFLGAREKPILERITPEAIR